MKRGSKKNLKSNLCQDFIQRVTVAANLQSPRNCQPNLLSFTLSVKCYMDFFFLLGRKKYIVALRKGLFGSNVIKRGRVSGGSSLSSAASRCFLPTAQTRNVLSRPGLMASWWSLSPPRQICKGQVVSSNKRQTEIFHMTLSLLRSYLLVEKNAQMFLNA